MKAKEIRTVDVLESLRVSVSQEIEDLLETGQDRQTLERVKAQRQELGGIKDELTIAKNIEAAEAKERRIAEIRAAESGANEAYHKMLSLAQDILPVLKQVEPLTNQIAVNNQKRVQYNNQLDGMKQRWQHSYNGRLEVRQPMVGVMWMEDAQAVHNYIVRLEGMIAEAHARLQAL